MKFRSKVVEIEAFQWLQDEVPDWWRLKEGIEIEVDTGSAFIPTLEGVMEAKPGDWIIQGLIGEIYPCKDEVFRMKYEPIGN